MTTLLRSDRGVLAPPVSATIYEGRVARVHEPGDALIYATGPEHRDTDEVTRIATQLAGIPVYLNHPAVFPAKESGEKQVGYVESGRVDDDSAVARIVITDKETLDAIASGIYELSLGYRVGRLDEKRYQREIVLDHLAVVPRGRCGPVCAMRTDMLSPMEETMKLEPLEVEVKVVLSDESKAVIDSVNAVAKDCTCNSHAKPYNTGESMSEPNKDTVAELTTQMEALKADLAKAHEAITALEIESTNARKDADKAKADLEAAQAEITAAKSNADEAVAKAKTDAADLIANELTTRVDARVALILEASQFKLDAELAKLSDREIKCAVIKHVDGDEVPAEKPDAFVDGVYYGALKRGARADESRTATRVAINEMRKDGAAALAKNDEAEAVAKMKRESTEAWKNSKK